MRESDPAPQRQRGTFGMIKMPFVAGMILGLGLWLFAEIFVFGLIADAIGLPGAILATLVTSLIGVVVLRRLGEKARGELRAIVAGGRSIRLEALQSGVSATVGAVLLILPGFLSDCIGLALVAPSLRRLEPARPAPKQQEILDLPPQDWRRIDDTDRS